jgi:hypothetical protein
MRCVTVGLALVFALAGAPAGAHAARHSKPPQGYSAAAQAVLAQARAAQGGSGWNLLRGWRETGHIGPALAHGGAVGVPYESWFDILRYGMRLETHEPAGLAVQGFNGQGYWRIEPSGATVPVDDRIAVEQARTAAFLGARGYFYPGRFDAHGELLGVRQAGGRAFDVVSVEPYAGRPRELWFDRAGHLLARIVDRSGAQPVTTELSDYRRVGPIRVAFHVTVRGPGGAVEERQVDTVIFAAPDRSTFGLPRPGED